MKPIRYCRCRIPGCPDCDDYKEQMEAYEEDDDYCQDMREYTPAEQDNEADRMNGEKR